jgi:hypothetical protein
MTRSHHRYSSREGLPVGVIKSLDKGIAASSENRPAGKPQPTSTPPYRWPL